MEHLRSRLQTSLGEILEVFHHPANMRMSAADYKPFVNAADCRDICCDQLGDDRVRDHCHVAGKYHNARNLKLSI